MKRTLTRLTLFILFAALFPMACQAQAPQDTDTDVCTGCYSDAAVTDEAIRDAADFAIKTQQETLGEELKLVEIVGAESQVVAGMNYRLKLKVELNGEEKTAEAVVYEALWKPVQRQLTSWAWE